MVRHVLVATDGTALSARAVRHAVGLAKALGAKLTALTVVAPYLPPDYARATLSSMDGFRKAAATESRRVLAAFNAAARSAGVEASAASVVGGEPWRDILRAARSRKCDLIVMASHGRRGLAGLVLGSETAKVLTHSRIPVLVCR